MTTPHPSHLGKATLGKVVDALCDSNAALAGRGKRPRSTQIFPSRNELVEMMEELRAALFPGYFGPTELTAESARYHVGATLDRVARTLEEQIKRALAAVCEEDPAHCEECEKRAVHATRQFIERLPEVRRLLGTDVQAAFEGDPAATSPDEAILCYPGLFAITNQRCAHELRKLDVPLIPRMLTEHAHTATGIDIHPGARIGEYFFIDHGTGVVIGETCIIGNRVRLYQGVTLGAKSFPLDEQGNPIKGVDRHPIVEDEVTIYAGATILGRITIGKGSTIGGNVWVTQPVAAGSSVTQAQKR